MNKAIEHSSVHHFADDTNILFIKKSLKKINRYINRDLKIPCQWIRSNKLSLNSGETEIIIFKRKHQVITKHLKFRVSGQKINPTISVKYLGVFLNDSLTWATDLSNLTPKLNRAIGLLAKIRYYTPKSLLIAIYYSRFNSHLIDVCQIWGQAKSNLFKKVQKLQEKALWIINFVPSTAQVNKIYKNSKILKISDYVSLQNAFFVKDCFIANLPETFSKYFAKTKEHHH